MKKSRLVFDKLKLSFLSFLAVHLLFLLLRLLFFCINTATNFSTSKVTDSLELAVIVLHNFVSIPKKLRSGSDSRAAII